MIIVNTPKFSKNDANFPIPSDPGPRLKYTENSLSIYYHTIEILDWFAKS